MSHQRSARPAYRVCDPKPLLSNRTPTLDSFLMHHGNNQWPRLVYLHPPQTPPSDGPDSNMCRHELVLPLCVFCQSARGRRRTRRMQHIAHAVFSLRGVGVCILSATLLGFSPAGPLLRCTTQVHYLCLIRSHADNGPQRSEMLS